MELPHEFFDFGRKERKEMGQETRQLAIYPWEVTAPTYSALACQHWVLFRTKNLNKEIIQTI